MNYPPVLFMNMTNSCTLNCSYCYIHNRDKKDHSIIEADLGDMCEAVRVTAPRKLVFTGGEPLLKAKEIVGVVNFFRANFREHWYTTICSNLYFDNLDDKQLDAITAVDYLQTTYSVDRFENRDIDLFIRNCDTARNYRQLKKVPLDVIITLTEKQLASDPSTTIAFILDKLQPTGINIETLSYSDNFHTDYESLYRRSDQYMLELCKLIPRNKNLLLDNWNKALDSRIEMNCTICSSGMSRYFDVETNTMSNGCPCLIESNISRVEKFKNLCVSCEYFKYCKMDCERFGNYCAFPKKTFDYLLQLRGGI